MKIIKQETPIEEGKVKECYKCKTVFEYVQSDTEFDREGKYVKCPSCQAFIAVD